MFERVKNIFSLPVADLFFCEAGMIFFRTDLTSKPGDRVKFTAQLPQGETFAALVLVVDYQEERELYAGRVEHPAEANDYLPALLSAPPPEWRRQIPSAPQTAVIELPDHIRPPWLGSPEPTSPPLPSAAPWLGEPIGSPQPPKQWLGSPQESAPSTGSAGLNLPQLARSDPAEPAYAPPPPTAEPEAAGLAAPRLPKPRSENPASKVTAGPHHARGAEMGDKIIEQAVRSGATDVHFETFADGLLIRFRQDGGLRTIKKIDDSAVARSVLEHLKLLFEKDRRGSGQVSTTVLGRPYDLRISLITVAEGESAVVRLISKAAFDTSLHDLGLSQEQLTPFQRCLNRARGLVLACGPRGSGKSTTLYSSLRSLQRADRKLITVEDPIKRGLPGVLQVPVNGSGFASALRQVMKQDPDVILVGEIRDEDTAQLSVQAALVGHLVLASMPAFDAVDAVDCLKDHGVKNRQISAALSAVIAQRLARRVCPHCAQEVLPSMSQMELLISYGHTSAELLHGVGCKECGDSGSKGRVGIFELLEISDPLRELVASGAHAGEITRVARSEGMSSLLADALFKAAAGLISLGEVERVCMLTPDWARRQG